MVSWSGGRPFDSATFEFIDPQTHFFDYGFIERLAMNTGANSVTGARTSGAC